MPGLEGILFVARALGKGVVREEQVRFSDLQGLLDACAANEGAALVRVEISGTTMGERRRLVLDLGRFGREGEA